MARLCNSICHICACKCTKRGALANSLFVCFFKINFLWNQYSSGWKNAFWMHSLSSWKNTCKLGAVLVQAHCFSAMQTGTRHSQCKYSHHKRVLITVLHSYEMIKRSVSSADVPFFGITKLQREKYRDKLNQSCGSALQRTDY